MPRSCVRSVRMAERRDKQSIGIFRIDDDVRDLLRIAQAEMHPGLAAVGGFIETIARREVRALLSLARADVDHRWTRRRDGNRSDRAGGLVVEDRLPRAAGVGRLPHAAIDDANEERVRLTGNAVNGFGAAGAMRADHAPAHLTQRTRIDRRWRLGADGRPADDEEKGGEGDTEKPGAT